MFRGFKRTQKTNKLNKRNLHKKQRVSRKDPDQYNYGSTQSKQNHYCSVWDRWWRETDEYKKRFGTPPVSRHKIQQKKKRQQERRRARDSKSQY